MSEKRVILSGIRATGRLHLGNYIGAIRKFVRLAEDPSNTCFFFIANLHTLTTFTDPKALKTNLIEVTLDYIAAGLDPERCTIYAQSSVPETCELNTLLTNLSPMGDLDRMPHFKEKARKKADGSYDDGTNAGLFQYPILMAADILGPLATHVPVGEDQEVHVEFARSLARRFNNRYRDLFPIPTVMSDSIRVPNLRGEGKMSKSGDETVTLSDSRAEVERKIKAAVTDPQRQRRNDPGDPNVCNIYTIHGYLDTPSISNLYDGCRNASIGCGDCKHALVECLMKELDPIQERRKKLDQRGEERVREILHVGGMRARRRIRATVEAVKDAMGVPSY
jgi:tryptophanyl-tRNA synthetase